METGTEGPRHDPYAWEEFTVHCQNGNKVTYRSSGLGYTRTTVLSDGNPRVVETRGVGNQDGPAEHLFTLYAKITPHVAERAYWESKKRRITNHLRACHSHTKRESGYPGESFTVCAKCGEVLETSFNISAVE